MKLLSILFVVAACGGGPKKPDPINNEVNAEPKPTGPAGQGKSVTKTAQGGIIELDGDRGAAMTDANEQMTAHCGPGAYVITQEGEEVVGSPDAQPTKTAWRVYYQCSK